LPELDVKVVPEIDCFPPDGVSHSFLYARYIRFEPISKYAKHTF
jgi:hypothetical protein